MQFIFKTQISFVSLTIYLKLNIQGRSSAPDLTLTDIETLGESAIFDVAPSSISSVRDDTTLELLIETMNVSTSKDLFLVK